MGLGMSVGGELATASSDPELKTGSRWGDPAMSTQWKTATAALACVAILSLAGCGSDGDRGPAGEQGPPGDPAPTPDPVAAAIAQASVETCVTCHGGVGEEHSAVYKRYVDGSALAMTFDDVASVPDGSGGFNVTLRLTITKDGQPFVDLPGLPSLDEKRFYAVQYDSTTGEYLNGNTRLRETSVVPGAAPGQYVLVQNGLPFAPEAPNPPFDGSQVYGYIAQGALFEHSGGSSAEIPASSHVHLYDDVANAALAFGTAAAGNPNAYASAANVSGCEKCHGSPYLKHGYRNPVVAGLPDFSACKTCHYDDRNGGHPDWQYMVDDPGNWATAGLPDADVAAKYAYKAKLMNDVHMAHAMEFPYPQSMSNCATCHEGKLDQVLANTNFTLETCRSCHPVDGVNAWPEAAGTTPEGDYAQEHRAPPLQYLWTKNGVTFHDPVTTPTCQNCHGVFAPTFDEFHTGYDIRIADASGTKYRDVYTASIDNVSRDGNLLTVEFSANNPDVSPELLVSFYGWDSKNYIVPSHARDGTNRCVRRGNPVGCDLEIDPGDTNPVFSRFEQVDPGSWVATLDMAQWLNGQPGFIPDLIADGVIRKAEITVTPRLTLDVGGENVNVVLDAVGETFDLNAKTLLAGYFKGNNAIVDTDKCDVCHDSLASSFHDGSGRGGGGIQVCKNCHNPTFPGSHLEQASRSIENYVHAIHSFQAFDTGSAFGTFDPVVAKRYDQHINHTFPRFTIRNCEACHFPGTYEVPDQAETMPGVLSATYDTKTWYTMVDRADTEGCSPCIPDTIAAENAAGRKINGPFMEYVVGPASRACGGCHRADLINADAASELASFNAHARMGGTYVENVVADGVEDQVLFGVIDKIMSWFD